MLQHQLDLASSDVQLSVVDSLLITYYPGLALAAVYDPSIGGRKPLAAPTPVAFPSKPSPEQVQPFTFILYGASHVADMSKAATCVCLGTDVSPAMPDRGLGNERRLPLECSAVAGVRAQPFKLIAR